MVRMVGRQPETARVSTFLAECRRGPSVLVIEGEAGIGKSTLFEEAVAAVPAQLRLLQVRCVQAEAGLAYSGLADLLGAWTSAVLPALAAPQGRALEIALLRADAGPDVVEPHVLGRATLAALQYLAAARPVLVAIDDVHWLDRSSARALGFALRRLGQGTALVSVLATRRAPAGLLPLGMDEVLPTVRWDRLVLGPLAAADLEVMLAERFGGCLPRRLLGQVWAAAAGNPLFATELVAARTLSGRPLDDPAPLPPRLEQLLAERVGRLPAATAEPLAAVASLAAPTVAMVLAALGEGARTGLNLALDADVLRIEEGRLWFAHPLLGVAALTRLSPSTRRALHDRLAAVALDSEERARHLVLAADGPDATVAAAAEHGANLARARGAPDVAAELAEAAVRLTPRGQGDDVRRRRIAAGYHWVTAGEAGRGRAHLGAALDDAPPGPVRAELRWRLGMLYHLDCDLSEAIRLLEAALAEADGHPALQATIARKLANLYGWRGRLPEALHHANAALSWAERADDRRVLLETLTGYTQSMLFQGTAIPDDVLRRMSELSQTTGPFPAHEDPETILAIAAFVHGDLDAAATGLQRVLQRAEEQGDEIGIAWLASYLAQVELTAGRWATASRLAIAAVDQARAVRVPLALPPRAVRCRVRPRAPRRGRCRPCGG